MNTYFGGSLRALSITFRNIFRPAITEGMRGPEAHEERYRGSFALTHNEHGEEACIACQACAKICPSQVITVVAGPKKPSEATGKKRGWSEEFVINLQACILCGLCVQACPEDALVAVRPQERPGFSREDLVLTRDLIHFKRTIEQKLADMIYEGQWFDPLTDACMAFLESTQERVSGTIRLRLYKGNCTPEGRKSPNAVYDMSLATYTSDEDTYTHEAAKGFIDLWGLPIEVWARVGEKNAEGSS